MGWAYSGYAALIYQWFILPIQLHMQSSDSTEITRGEKHQSFWLAFEPHNLNPFNPKLIMQTLPTIQKENDWVL